MLKPMRKYALKAWCARIAFVSTFLASAATADASNLDFLNDTPMSYINKRDIESIRSALIDVLNTNADGEMGRWMNEGTGNSVQIGGMLTPETTIHEGTGTCRRVLVVLVAKGQSMEFHPRYCKSEREDWTLQRR
ncbi:hypothetical protein [Paraburkholderia azotifigens]|uniref:Surface antigen domain-containing protein n=1 Tax=Paraburkholderia azotifigens TaxID=2057004 RepID=A0ABU9R3F2_9BURK